MDQITLIQIEILGVFLILLFTIGFILFAAVYSVQHVSNSINKFEQEILQVMRLVGASRKEDK